MVIYGWKTYVQVLAVLQLVCGQCGNASEHVLRKLTTKFTLFFIPLFPFSTKFSTQCTFCGMEQRITKEQAEQLQAQAAGIQPQAQGYGQPQQQPGQQPYQH